MRSIAIIPARKGSKRIPDKNIKSFLGQPIIAYSIRVAIESNLFEEVMVSTDDDVIAEIAIKYGASVPFKRSSKNADDFATTTDVLLEVIDNYEKEGRLFDIGCCLYATAPLITAEKLITAHALFLSMGFKSVFPVVKYNYPVQRSLSLVNGKARMNFPEHLNTRSQDLEPWFHDSGQFYFFKVPSLQNDQKLFTDNSGGIEISQMEAQDIDEPSDWEVAELKYKLLHKL